MPEWLGPIVTLGTLMLIVWCAFGAVAVDSLWDQEVWLRDIHTRQQHLEQQTILLRDIEASLDEESSPLVDLMWQDLEMQEHHAELLSQVRDRLESGARPPGEQQLVEQAMIRRTLDQRHLEQLLRGEVVELDGVEICLQDIGVEALLVELSRAVNKRLERGIPPEERK